MICPNCKTELVEVNGRYICSDCGREIPENEVMASDWGNGGNTRAGLYGAGTDEVQEEGTEPISDFDASLTELENVAEPTQPSPEVAQPAIADELSVEEILQEQATEQVPDAGFYTPETLSAQPAALEVPEVVLPVVPERVAAIPVEVSAILDSITPVVETEAQTPAEVLTPQPVIEVSPVSTVMPETPAMIPDISLPQTQTPIEQPEAPVEIPAATNPETVMPQAEVEALAPQAEQVVTDMFAGSETVAAPLAADPGIYTDPMYENTQVPQPTGVVAATNSPMPADKRTTIAVLVGGVVLILLLVVGGAWAYLSLNKTVQPVVTPVEDSVTWQELQVVDGGFKVSFPGTPEKADNASLVAGVEKTVTSYSSTTGDVSYTVGYASLDTSQSQPIVANPTTTMPVLVEELATNLGLTSTVVKTGKYYAADAIDFTLASDTAAYQGKIMVLGDKYLYVLAGSEGGQDVDYTKFVKSFSFTSSGVTK